MYVLRSIIVAVLELVITFAFYVGSYYGATLLLGVEFNLPLGATTALILLAVSVLARKITELIERED